MSNNQSDNDNEKKITKTIEEIAPDDRSTSEDLVMVDNGDGSSCPKCGFNMVNIKPCMLRCQNCGSVKDCSEKGIW